MPVQIKLLCVLFVGTRSYVWLVLRFLRLLVVRANLVPEQAWLWWGLHFNVLVCSLNCSLRLSEVVTTAFILRCTRGGTLPGFFGAAPAQTTLLWSIWEVAPKSRLHLPEPDLTFSLPGKKGLISHLHLDPGRGTAGRGTCQRARNEAEQGQYDLLLLRGGSYVKECKILSPPASLSFQGFVRLSFLLLELWALLRRVGFHRFLWTCMRFLGFHGFFSVLPSPIFTHYPSP